MNNSGKTNRNIILSSEKMKNKNMAHKNHGRKLESFYLV